MSILLLPCTVAEAVDKYSILRLKSEKITDLERLSYVKGEMDLLYDKLKDHLDRHQKLFDQLYQINRGVWIFTDKINEPDRDYDYLHYYKFIHHLNNMRFRVKDKINNVTRSLLKEQKSYAKTTLKLKISSEDLDKHTKLLEYLSNSYDSVVLHTTEIKGVLATDITREYDNIVVVMGPNTDSDMYQELDTIMDYYNLYTQY